MLRAEKGEAVMKKMFYVIIVILVVLLVFPLSNLLRSRDIDPALTAKAADPNLQKLSPAFQQKCMDCHAAGANLPFYSNFPVAKAFLQQDIRTGREHLDMPAEFFSGQPAVAEAALAKTQKVIQDDSMPPFRYRVLHWGSALTDQEKKDSLNWIRVARAKANRAEDVNDPIYAEPVLPLEALQGLNPDKVALGKKLYHDTRLSKDNSLSCASCHDLTKGGTDQQPVSDGINGQMGPINSPTVFNAAYALAQFWDGRAKDLREQANGPVNNPIEMGSNWEEVLGKLETDKEYAAAFAALYPDGMTGDNITDSIAEFERSLVTANSRFDQFLRGNAQVMTAEEKQGYSLFKSYGCNTCHAGQAMGGTSFEKMGVYADYFAARGNAKEADNGRYSVTKRESDRHKFKVPTLRNIALTFPYFHDGSTSDLHQAVKTMAHYQTEKAASENDVHLIMQFLQTLTGEYEGQTLK
jgi:cytochrome c peroxidase